MAHRCGAHYNQPESIPSPVRRTLLPLTALLAALAAVAPAAAQQVTVERDTALHSEPNLGSSQVTQLKQGATGEVIGKQGAWLNLKTPGGSGWLFSFNVRFQRQQAGAGDSGASSTAGRLFGSRRSASVTSTIGIRGIEEEDLKQASFNADQMKRLESYAATKEAAERRAHATGLAPASVEYMDATK